MYLHIGDRILNASMISAVELRFPYPKPVDPTSKKVCFDHGVLIRCDGTEHLFVGEEADALRAFFKRTMPDEKPSLYLTEEFSRVMVGGAALAKTAAPVGPSTQLGPEGMEPRRDSIHGPEAEKLPHGGFF